MPLNAKPHTDEICSSLLNWQTLNILQTETVGTRKVQGNGSKSLRMQERQEVEKQPLKLSRNEQQELLGGSPLGCNPRPSAQEQRWAGQAAGAKPGHGESSSAQSRSSRNLSLCFFSSSQAVTQLAAQELHVFHETPGQKALFCRRRQPVSAPHWANLPAFEHSRNLVPSQESKYGPKLQYPSWQEERRAVTREMPGHGDTQWLSVSLLQKLPGGGCPPQVSVREGAN